MLISLIGLGLLISKPKYYTGSPGSSIILLTEGNAKRPPGKNVFRNVHDFLNSPLANQTNIVHIHGFGLTKSNLQLLSAYQLEFHPEPLIPGITRVELPKITEGEEWTLKGSFIGDEIEQINLLTPLGDKKTGSISDSLFQISSYAPVAGDYLYTVEIIFQNGDTLSEILPVTVHHSADWNMLVLSSFPSFEINYLKNFWTQKGYGFALKLQIARDNYYSSFVNIQKMNLERINKSEISRFDFLMTDVASWNGLARSNRNLIIQSIRDDGLALIIRPDIQSKRATGISHPPWGKPIQSEFATLSDVISYTEYPLSNTSWSKLTTSSFNYGAYTKMGLGHVLCLGIDETYKFILSDEESIYQEIWSDIFSKFYRDFNPSTGLIRPEWIWENELTRFIISTQEELEGEIYIHDSISTPILKLPFINGFNEVAMWPEKGYNNIKISEFNTTLNYYAHSKDAWQSIRQNWLSQQTHEAVNKSRNREETSLTQLTEIPFYFWYLLILLGFGSLWLDETLYE